MFHLRHPWLAAMLASTLLLVQTASSWMHVGCVHDHSAPHAHAHHHDHSGCGHHHDHCDSGHDDERACGLVDGHRHSHVGTAHECPACRFLLVSSLAVELNDVPLVEAVSLYPSAVTEQNPVAPFLGGYFSRGPPQLG